MSAGCVTSAIIRGRNPIAWSFLRTYLPTSICMYISLKPPNNSTGACVLLLLIKEAAAAVPHVRRSVPRSIYLVATTSPIPSHHISRGPQYIYGALTSNHDRSKKASHSLIIISIFPLLCEIWWFLPSTFCDRRWADYRGSSLCSRDHTWRLCFCAIQEWVQRVGRTSIVVNL